MTNNRLHLNSWNIIMYKQADEQINNGLSLGARIFLGSISALLGGVMIISAPENDKALMFYLFAGFCLLITLACFTKNRVRQFAGSIVGVLIFLAGVVYLISEIESGLFWSGQKSEPSVFNAMCYLFFIGLPGISYAYKTRFGFPAQKNNNIDSDNNEYY